MFSKTQTIIAINKEKLIAVMVNASRKKIVKTLELGWDFATIDLAFEKIKKDLKAKRVRILFGEELSYVLKIEVPGDVEKGKEKDYITQKVSEQIPESMENSDWDYQDLRVSSGQESENSKMRDFIIFAPVKSVFEIVSSASLKVGFDVEAMEPEQVAKTRDVNPLIGLALKADINAGDEEVLNLKPKENYEMVNDKPLSSDKGQLEEVKTEKVLRDVEVISESNDQGDSFLVKKKRLITVVLIAIILSIWTVGALYFLYFAKGNKKPVEVGQKTDLISQKTLSSPTNEPIPSVMEPDLASFKIQVQNGSGIAGEAGYVAGLLKEAGFEDVDTANATSSAFVETQVRADPQIEELVLSKIMSELQDLYLVSTSSAALDDFDVVIIVGQRKSD